MNREGFLQTGPKYDIGGAVMTKKVMDELEFRTEVYLAYKEVGMSKACEVFNKDFKEFSGKYVKCERCDTETPHIGCECLCCGHMEG